MTIDIETDYDFDLRRPVTQAQLQYAVMHALAHGKIHLNGYACVRPSDEFLRDLGAQVIALLNNPVNTLPAIDINETNMNAYLSPFQVDNPALYLKITKS